MPCAAELVAEPIVEAAPVPMPHEPRARLIWLLAGAESGAEAGEAVHALLDCADTDVKAADLSEDVDAIPHHHLMPTMARRAADRNVLRRIVAWLHAPVEQCGDDGKRRMPVGQAGRMGAPRGGVISPLLADP